MEEGIIDFGDIDVTVDREKWVGGSDYPSIIGLSGFNTAYDIYLDKTGIVPSANPETPYTYYGHRMESIIRDYINGLRGMNFQPASVTRPRLHMRGNMDGYDSDILLEIKTNGTGKASRSYRAQMDFYMTCKETMKKGILAVYKRPEDYYHGFQAETLSDADFNLTFDPANLFIYEVLKPDKVHKQAIKHNVNSFMKIVKAKRALTEQQFNLILKGLLITR